MTTQNRKPTVVLSLVKDSAGTGARFVSLETLDQERKELVQKYQRLVFPGSVLVGAIMTAAPWDIRPVLLHRGQMTVTRVFSPELLQSLSLTDAFKSYIFHIEQLSPGTQALACGSSSYSPAQDALAWVTRKYFTSTLSDTSLDIPLTERPRLMHQLIKDVERLHQEGMIHGHIHPGNIAYDQKRLILLDHGFQIYDPGQAHPQTLSPELRQTALSATQADSASDVYGLGLVAKRLFGGELAVEYGNLVEVLLLTDPKLRPKLPQMAKHFAVSEQTPSPVLATAPTAEPTAVAWKPSVDVSKIIAQLGGSTRLLGLTCGALFLAAIGTFTYAKITTHSQSLQDRTNDSDRLTRLWDSKQVSLMQQVVKAVLDNDPSATDFLRKRLESGDETHPAIQEKFFKIGFHPLWSEDLSAADFKALILFGAPSLVPPSKRQSPDLSVLHPAVSFAVAATINPVDGFAPLQSVSTKRLGTLTSMYGSAFLALDHMGVTDLGSITAQYLAHILTDDFSPTIILGFLNLDSDPKTAFTRLEVLQPLYESVHGLSDAVIKALAINSDHPLTWFSKDIVAGWEKVPSLDRINLFSGTMPVALSFEQRIDLLRFPRSGIREQAMSAATKELGPNYQKLLEYLASDECELTRTQTISLFATIRLSGEAGRPFALQWFDTHPAAKAVVEILSRKPNTNADDPFSVAAAKYLLAESYQLSPQEIVGLSNNQESLVRAYAYSQLKVEDPLQKQVLQKLLALEKDPGLKTRLESRLR